MCLFNRILRRTDADPPSCKLSVAMTEASMDWIRLDGPFFTATGIFRSSRNLFGSNKEAQSKGSSKTSSNFFLNPK